MSLNKPNEVNLDGVLRHAEDFLAKAQSLPQNTSADGNGGAFKLSDTMASVEVIAVVNEEVTLADTKALTVKLQESADDSSYADLATLYTLTSAGGDTIAAGTVLGKYLIPTTAKKYVKAVLVSDDAALAGKVDVFAVYVPR